MKARVAPYNGTPALFIDDVPCTGLMSWDRYPTEEDTALFRDAGLEFYSFMGNLFIPHAGVPDKELTTVDGGADRMRLTRENIDRTMEMLLGVNPQLKILPRIILNAPRWWLKEHPDECLRTWSIPEQKFIVRPRPSFGAPAWKKLWQPALAELVRYFETRWGEHIFGYHTGMGHCGEHTYMWWDNICDFSPAQLNDFRIWLQKKYTAIETLNQRWGREYRDFAEIPLPEATRFVDNTVRAKALFLPESELDLVDFQRFCSDLVAETICLEAQTVKNTLREMHSEKICGVFYGYINLVANSTQETSGHNALTKVLESPDIDFICGPLSYAARQNGGTVMPQMIPGSMVCRNKLFYNEDDTGTHVVQRQHHGYIPATAEDSLNAERRNFLETWSSGGTQWWMDLYGTGWFLDPRLGEEFSRLRRFAERHLADRRSMAEIAVFVSLESSDFVRDTPAPLTGNLIEHQLAEICACGAPHDLYQLADLPLLAEQGKLGQYKMCIFLNCTAVEKDTADLIDRELKNAGRTLLWFYAPGYIQDDRRDARFAQQLTGINFSVVEEGIMPMVTEFWLDGHRFSYGLSRAVYPRLTANDPQAEELGYWVNGTTIVGQQHGNGASLVSRRFADWRSVWSASPGMPAALITAFARETGVHIFSERGDQVFFGPDWIGIHAKCSGTLELALPAELALTDTVTGEKFTPGRKLTLTTRRGETRIWEF